MLREAARGNRAKGAVRRRICVFCGASAGHSQANQSAAQDVARGIAALGWGVVYGGASVGLMGTLADSALALGVEVIGVIPRALAEKEIAHVGLDRLDVVDSMHERKARMVELSDAFLALPGGFGTLDELFEVVTFAQLGLHEGPIGLLNVDGFYDPLLAFVDGAVAAGLVRPDHRQLLITSHDAHKLLDALAESRTPTAPRWLTDASQT